MSYVAFDLDALNKAPHVARAIGCVEDTILGGLIRLWAHCFREAREVVAEIEVQGLFGVDAKDALVAFGFLETVENGFRVKGADRYLRVTEGRKKGGQNSKHNLVPGAKQKQIANELRGESQPRVSREPGEDKGEEQAMESLASVSPFHRTPIKLETSKDVSTGVAGEKKKKAQKEKAKAQDVAQEHFIGISWADAVKTLFELFEKLRGAKYAPTGRDFAALEAMAKRTQGDFAEVSRRWVNALRSGFPVVGELWQLEQKFNQFAAGEKPKTQAEDPNQGILRQPEKIDVCAICAECAEFEVWGRPMCAQHRAQWDESAMCGERETAAWVEAERLLP